MRREPLSMQAWGNQQGKPEWVWEYDLERAKQLLAEAGYPDGFEVDLYPAVRGAPSEVEACEAIAVMWEELGLDVNIIQIPFNTLVEAWLGLLAEGYSLQRRPTLYRTRMAILPHTSPRYGRQRWLGPPHRL